MPAERFSLPHYDFSIVHPSARPHKVVEIFRAWAESANRPDSVEYVLVTDPRWGARMEWRRAIDVIAPIADKLKVRFFIRENIEPLPEIAGGRRGYVAAVNLGAAAARGNVLIVIADDQYPCKQWDFRIRTALRDGNQGAPAKSVFAKTGTPNEFERRICVMPILTRARYNDLGNVFYPGYESWFADNDYFETAAKDALSGRVELIFLDSQFVFPHKHPTFDWQTGEWRNALDGVGWDPVYEAQNTGYATMLGEIVFRARRQRNFGELELAQSDIDEAHAAVKRALGGHPEYPVLVGSDVVDSKGQLFVQNSPLSNQQVTKESFADSKGVSDSRFPDGPPVVGVCCPGEWFHMDYMMARDKVMTALCEEGFVVRPFYAHSSDAAVTRQCIVDQVYELPKDLRPDYLLWFDDDNLPTAEVLERLFRILSERPDADVAAAWCWCDLRMKHTMRPSCGPKNLDGAADWFDPIAFEKLTEPLEVYWTGFPCLVMRTQVFQKLSRWPFCRITDEKVFQGAYGEDFSFCMRLAQAGGKIIVDPRARVEHQKIANIRPRFVMDAILKDVEENQKSVSQVVDSKEQLSVQNIPLSNQQDTKESFADSKAVTESGPEPLIIGMMRVKNEARWIGRAIRSLGRLCHGLMVLDDRSEDATRAIADDAACEVFGGDYSVYDSPFESLNEARDKEWLLERVVEYVRKAYGRARLDNLWIWCMDGDEELPAGAAETLRAMVKSGEHDAFMVGFLYLWNDPRKLRVDGRFLSLGRVSLFRYQRGKSDFRSLYFEGADDLHVGNAPIEAHRKAVPVQATPVHSLYSDLNAKLTIVRLLHYGYMLPEDRKRKVAWYSVQDPNNASEGRYQHLIQGDEGGPSASAYLTHGGPLRITDLPKELYPSEPWTEEELVSWLGAPVTA